jgi:hypothetical protein
MCLGKESDPFNQFISKTSVHKRHYMGNSKNSPSKNYAFTSTRHKKFYASEKSPKDTSTDHILGKGCEKCPDVMDGHHKRRVGYRQDQVKDAINYK